MTQQAIIYAREGDFPIPEQVARCRAYLAKNGWAEAGVVIDTDTSRARPAFLDMLRQNDRTWDIIVVADLLRIGNGWDDIYPRLVALDRMRIGLHSLLGREIKPKHCPSALHKRRTLVNLDLILAYWREQAYEGPSART